MDLLHITPRALARVSYLSLLLENSPGRPLSITAVCPTSVSILNLLLTPLPFPRLVPYLLYSRLLPYPLYFRLLPSLFYHSPFERMGRKRTTEDYNRIVKENSWVPGVYKEEDRIQQTEDEPSRRYKQNQQGGASPEPLAKPATAQGLDREMGQIEEKEGLCIRPSPQSNNDK